MRENTIIWYCDDLPFRYPTIIRNIYEKCYVKNRTSYAFWLDKINKKLGDDIDWWMTLVPSRDPYNSNILHYISILETIKKTQKIKIKFFSSSKELIRIIEKNFSKKKINCYFIKKNLSNIFYNLLKSLIFNFFLFFYINLFEKKKLNNNIVIIDKFITKNNNQNINYFPILKKKNYYIVPTFVPTLNLIHLFKMIKLTKKNNKNILWKEHYIKLSDILFALLNYIRRRKFKNFSYHYKKFNLSSLVYEEIKNYSDYYSIATGIINYRFFLRLSKYDFFKIKSLNWFENQVIDKGWNMGFRKYFKKFSKNTFGYQDFGKHYNLTSHNPSISEYQKKVTPENLIIISKYFKKISCEFFRNQKIIIGETQRFRSLLELKNNLFKKKILFILSGIKKIDIELLNIAKKICLLESKSYFYIKCHPILKKSLISNESFPKNMVFLDTDLNLILKKTLVSITAGPSSAILESICYGAFLILPNIECGTSFNPKMFGFKNYLVTNNISTIIKKIKTINQKKLILNNYNFLIKEKFKHISDII